MPQNRSMKVGCAKFADPMASQAPPYLRIGRIFAGSHHSTDCILAFAQAIARHWRQNAGPLGYAMLVMYFVERRIRGPSAALGMTERQDHAARRTFAPHRCPSPCPLPA